MRGRTLLASWITSKPATQARPVLGASRVVRILIRVVLPAPFGPEQPKQLAAIYLKVDILQGDQRLRLGLLAAADFINAA